MDWKVVLDKVGTIIVDRRLWVSVFTILALVLGSDSILDGAPALSDQAVEIVGLIIKVIALLGVPLNLINSWTKRPPSGLEFKSVIDK